MTELINPSFLQRFLGVFDVLREELINDSLLGDQPAFAQQHLREVWYLACSRMLLLQERASTR